LLFCLSFRSEAEESVSALLVILAQPESLSLPFCLSFRSEAEESAFALLVILVQPESLSLPFCLSFRSEAEESAFALLVILVQPESLSLPFCLSFRSEAEESVAPTNLLSKTEIDRDIGSDGSRNAVEQVGPVLPFFDRDHRSIYKNRVSRAY